MIDLFSAVLYFATDIVFQLYFFRKMPIKQGAYRYSWISFLLLIPLYIPAGYTGFIDNAAVRQILRVLAVYCFLLMTRARREYLFYRAMYFSLIYSTVSNLFMIPVVSLLRKGQLFPIASPFLNLFISRLIQAAVIFAFMYVMDRYAGVENISHVARPRYYIYAGLTTLAVYIKATLRAWYKAGNDPYSVNSNLLPLFILLSILATVALIEFAFSQKDLETSTRLQAMAMRRQYESMLARMEAEENTRSFIHDIKNHLLAIHALAGDPDRLKSYIDELFGQLESAQVIETGDALTNSIISDLLTRAESADVALNYHVNFSKVNFIRDKSLCTIVSNALDNALEAARTVTDKDKRRIHFKTGTYANMFIMRFENYYQDELDWNDDDLKTTKKHPQEHGYGLKNLRSEVAKYNGTVEIETTPDRLFRLTVMIPVPQYN